MHKARSGLIRALVKVDKGAIERIIISGDFILVPEFYIDRMEDELTGVNAAEEAVLEKLRAFFSRGGFQSPETHPEDFTAAIMKAIEGVQKQCLS